MRPNNRYFQTNNITYVRLLVRWHTFILLVVAGNVAYNKAASQSIGDWGDKYPAGRAVDGDTNPSMAAGHCALPDTDWGKNAWWMVDLKDTYNFSRVIIYNRDSEGKWFVVEQCYLCRVVRWMVYYTVVRPSWPAAQRCTTFIIIANILWHSRKPATFLLYL